MGRLVYPLLLIFFAAPLSYYDFKYNRIPNLLSLGSWLSGLVVSFFLKELPLQNYLLGSAMALISYLLIYLLSSKKLGWGDIKLSLFLGGIGGWAGWLITNFIASLTGIIYYLLIVRLGKSDIKTPIPFAPFLCLGALLYQALSLTGWDLF
ncbi:MAG: A24 family peptidase [Spirochaetales bacterium]|nr:A24 family peptidase [Spirochaetales bacterium]